MSQEKTGIQMTSFVHASVRWIPACAGMTLCVEVLCEIPASGSVRIGIKPDDGA